MGVRADVLGSVGAGKDADAVYDKVVSMTEQSQSGDVAGADTDAPDPGADYDPDQDQDTEPSNMAPAGERPSDTEATS
jgi:hypothetical protein